MKIGAKWIHFFGLMSFSLPNNVNLCLEMKVTQQSHKHESFLQTFIKGILELEVYILYFC